MTLAVTSLPGSSTVLTLTPFLAVSVVVTVPSFLVSTSRVEPSLNIVVSVTVPVFLSVMVVVVEPSGFLTVSVVLLELPELLELLEPLPEEPPSSFPDCFPASS